MSDFPPPPPPPFPGAQPGPGGPPPGGGAPQGFQQYGYGYGYGAVPVEPAGFWSRFAAAFLDGLVLFVPGLLIGAIVGSSGVSVNGGYSVGASIAANLLNIAVGMVYFGYFEGTTGQTLGKKAMNLKVVDFTTGEPGIGIGRGIGRYFARWLSQIALFLGYLWMLWDKDKQTWHDKLTSVRVVKV